MPLTWGQVFGPGLRLALLLAAAAACAVPAAAGDLAPTGRLRAVFLGTNPVQARTDPKTGEISGPVVDLVRELARRLNVPFTMIPAPNAQGVIAHVQDGTADIGFMAYEEARAREVDFAGAFAVMFNTYLVAASSPLRTVEDADRAGITIGAVRAQTQDLYLSAHLTRARLQRLEAQPSQAEMERLLSSGALDAIAQNTQRAQEAVAAAGTRVPLRALTGSYVAVEQSFVLKKGDAASVARLDDLVEELKASGFIKASIDRAGLTSVGVAPPRPRGAAATAPDVARMDAAVREWTSGNRFMGAVLVARGDEVLFSKAYGSASLELDVPNTPGTRFRIGSLTKQFTAAAILLLEERGRLSVDDLVNTHLPEAPAAWNRITIRHLLTHTSGIPNFTSFPDYAVTLNQPVTPGELVARFRDKPLDFPPGDKYSYSNSGYVVLGLLIERISTNGYALFLRDNVLRPLGLTETGYDSARPIVMGRAQGYAPTPNGPVNAAYIDMSVAYAAGGLYSTTGDLLRWQRALYGGRLLTAASLAKMTTPFKGNYGFGVAITSEKGRTRYLHTGGINGFNSDLAYFPDSQITVAVLANVVGPAADALLVSLSALAHGETVSPPKPNDRGGEPRR